jgi:hypothetical protein
MIIVDCSAYGPGSGVKPKREAPWNRCDECGRFISMVDFDKGAVRRFVCPDSELTRESYETLCVKHAS